MRGRARVTLTLLLAALLATSTLPVTTALSTTAPTTAPSQPSSSLAHEQPDSPFDQRPVEVAVTQVNDTAYKVTYSVDVPDGVTTVALWFKKPITITDQEGGSQNESSLGYQLEWTPDETGRKSVTVLINLDRRYETHGCFCTVANDWLYGPMPTGSITLYTANDLSSLPLSSYHAHINISQTASITGTGYVTPEFVYFGEYTTASAQANGQTITIITPADTTLQPVPVEGNADVGNTTPQQVATLLADSARTLNSGRPRRSPISILVHPNVHNDDPEIEFTSYRLGGQTFGATILVSEIVPPSLYVHEYVHTRHYLSLPTTNRTKWLKEGFAEYFSLLLTYQHGDRNWTEFRNRLRPGNGSDTLGAPTTWSSRRTPYDKGSYALAILDTNIRTATNGNRSLENVFGRLTGPDKPLVTVARLKAVVAQVVGDHRFDPLIDQLINNSTLPTATTAEWETIRTADPDADRQLFTPTSAGTPTATPASTPFPTEQPTTPTPPPTEPAQQNSEPSLQLTPRVRYIAAGAFGLFLLIGLLDRLV